MESASYLYDTDFKINMALFAKLDDDNTVLAVHHIKDEKVSDENGVSEVVGQNILTKIHGWPKWALTDANTHAGKYYTPGTSNLDPDQSKVFRGTRAGRGYIWDVSKGIFYTKQPHPSWILNETTASWESPVEYPTITTYIGALQPGLDGTDVDFTRLYRILWDEAGQQWTATDYEIPQGSFNWNTDTLAWDSA